jgi:hypothetical protein
LKKFLGLAVLVVMVVTALALPALAQGNRHNNPGWDNNNNPGWDNNNNPGWDNNNNPGWGNNNQQNNNNNPGGDWLNNWMNGGVSQDNQQAADSGASSQAIIVEGGGANSNQCVAIQPISNTGSALNQTDVSQYASQGDVGVNGGGNLSIKPSQSTTCDQKVNQAASTSANQYQ